MAVVTMRQLLEAGVHFGHQTRRWNPKMKRFIYGERNGIYIIDLQKTSAAIESTYGFLRDTVARGGNVLFVGTKKQAQESIKTQAERVGMPYVNFRWLGGMLTNFTTIYKRLQRLKEPAMEAKTAETMKSLAVTTIRSIRQPVASLSGGQRQSVAVARAVMWNSKLVILDEPTAALGVAQTRQVLDLVRRLAERGLGVVIVSHNLHDIFEVADRITALRLGQKVSVLERDATVGAHRHA